MSETNKKTKTKTTTTTKTINIKSVEAAISKLKTPEKKVSATQPEKTAVSGLSTQAYTVLSKSFYTDVGLLSQDIRNLRLSVTGSMVADDSIAGALSGLYGSQNITPSLSSDFLTAWNTWRNTYYTARLNKSVSKAIISDAVTLLKQSLAPTLRKAYDASTIKDTTVGSLLSALGQ